MEKSNRIVSENLKEAFVQICAKPVISRFDEDIEEIMIHKRGVVEDEMNEMNEMNEMSETNEMNEMNEISKMNITKENPTEVR